MSCLVRVTKFIMKTNNCAGQDVVENEDVKREERGRYRMRRKGRRREAGRRTMCRERR